MTKSEMVQVLRSVGCNENTITAMENAFDMGMEQEREECAKACYDMVIEFVGNSALTVDQCARMIRARGE